MINQQLLQPESIVVIGGSNNVHKPGGAVVRNLISGGYEGTLRVLNPKEDEVQGIKAFHKVSELPPTDLAILVVAARFCPDYVRELAAEKRVRAFIIISAGFSEETPAGAALEQQILDTCREHGCALIGPNCIGLLTRWHHSVFTKPIPHLTPRGVDFISGSGATAVFILESAVTKGLAFNSVWSVGNGHQIGIESVLEYMDDHFDAERDSLVKLLYIENIADPDKMLYHATSLIRKGCRIAAIKAGSSESGSRAASSHTGAIASSDAAVEALFRKAGIVRCFGREELTTAGCIFMVQPTPNPSPREGGLYSSSAELSDRKTNQSPLPGGGEGGGLRFAIVTHAGGPGVMLTDALSKGGMTVPPLTGEAAEELKAKLLPGSSVANPIDILATGGAEHLATAIDFCENHFPVVDAIMLNIGRNDDVTGIVVAILATGHGHAVFGINIVIETIGLEGIRQVAVDSEAPVVGVKGDHDLSPVGLVSIGPSSVFLSRYPRVGRDILNTFAHRGKAVIVAECLPIGGISAQTIGENKIYRVVEGCRETVDAVAIVGHLDTGTRIPVPKIRAITHDVHRGTRLQRRHERRKSE